MRRISLIPILFLPLFTLSSCHDLSFLFPSSPLKTNLPILPSGIYSLKASIAYPDCPIIAYMTIQELSEETFQSLNNKNCYYDSRLTQIEESCYHSLNFYWLEGEDLIHQNCYFSYEEEEPSIHVELDNGELSLLYFIDEFYPMIPDEFDDYTFFTFTYIIGICNPSGSYHSPGGSMDGGYIVYEKSW